MANGVERRVRRRAAILLLVGLSACAPKTVRPPAAPPDFSDFLFPGAPANLGPPDLIARHEQAWSFLQAGDLRRSEREFSRILKRAPGFFPAETALGYVELARRDDRDALSRFDRALQRSANYAPALVGRGEALLGLKRDDEALVSFEAALTAEPGLTDVRRRVEVLALRRAQENVTVARRAAEAGRLDEAKDAYARAVAASPDSPFLWRELALTERRQGDADHALEHLRKAVTLDPADVKSFVNLGEMLEERREFDAALQAYSTAAALEPSEEIDARLEALRGRSELARLPAEYRAIEATPHIDRAGLAALIGVRLEALLQTARRRQSIVMTDTRGHWALPWIMAVTRAGVMDVYPNHTFQPRTPVLRGDLAMAVSRVLNLIAAERPDIGKQWQGARRRMTDVAPGHLSYPAASLAVAADVLPLLDGDTFRLAQSVSGSEAIEAVGRLIRLADGIGVNTKRDGP